MEKIGVMVQEFQHKLLAGSEKKISAFGVGTMSPGVPGISSKEDHHICGELNFTNYENLINLQLLIGRGKFRIIGLP